MTRKVRVSKNHKHRWIPTPQLFSSTLTKGKREMMQVCHCGAYQWVKAFEAEMRIRERK